MNSQVFFNNILTLINDQAPVNDLIQALSEYTDYAGMLEAKNRSLLSQNSSMDQAISDIELDMEE